MKICPNCGSSFDDSMRFCVQCGTVLEEAPAASEAAETPVTEEVTQTPATPAETAVPAETAAPEAAAPQQEVPYEAQQPVFEQPQYAPYQQGYVPPYGAPVAPPPAPNPDDHTPEMDPEDIAEHKLYAMLIYLLGPIGIIIALLKNKESAFLNFHIKLSIKYLVVELVLLLASATVILSIPAGIMLTIIAVLEIITFVQVCKGQAKDPAIIKSIKFLN